MSDVIRCYKVGKGGPPRVKFEKPKPKKPHGYFEYNEKMKALCAVRAELVRQARESIGLTFKQIAARMDVSIVRVQQLYEVAKFGSWRR